MITIGARRAWKGALAGVAATLAVAGGISACGSLNAADEARAAAASLKDAHVASFTVHFDDPNGELAKSGTTADDKKTAQALADASLRLTVDPAGDATLGQAQTATPSSDPAQALKKSGAVELTYLNKGADVVTIRMVDGVLFAKANFAQIEKLAGEPLPVGEFTAGDPTLTNLVNGVKAGKWVSLDLSAFSKQLKDSGLADPTQASQLAPAQMQALGQELLDAVKAHSVTTEKVGANNEVVVNVTVKAKQALLAAIAVLERPQYQALLGMAGSDGVQAFDDLKAQVNKLTDSEVTGTLTSQDKHLKQLSVDLAGVAKLSGDPQAEKEVRTSKLVVDINDNAAAVTAPSGTDVISADSLITAFLGAAMAGGA